MSYLVRRHKHGYVVTGTIPLSHLVTLGENWKREGYDTADALIAKHYGAAFVVTTKKGSDEWRKELGLS